MSIILYLFYAVIIISTGRVLIRLFLSIAYNLTRIKTETNIFPKISIIVPAFNEAKTITNCIRSLQNLNYPNFEIIVVDDGSNDATYEVANQCEGAKVFRQKNQGKPIALNNGISHSSGEIILTVDADTELDRNALKPIANRFACNDKLGAVAGNVKVKREPTILNIIQSAEYATGINLVRKGQSVLGTVMVVPGPVAALKKEAIEQVGFFSDDTFAEDFDITVKILKKGYEIEYEEASLAYTDTPKSTEDLIKQRRRWYRGMLQVLDKHKGMYFNRKYGIVGFFGIPNLWFDTIAPFLNIGLLFVTLLTWMITGEFYVSLFGIATYLGVSLVLNILGLILEPKPEKRNYLALPLLLFYNMFLDGIRIMSLTEEMINILMDWEKPKR
ncbi:glycosyltransferase [Candidatus Bathyarchaeota archaeon]|nr:glycosyltransferase [Candidatus Bathyarchaeota archaeon]